MWQAPRASGMGFRRRLALLLAVLCAQPAPSSGGLLKVGKPMQWAQSLPHLAYVREHGVLQFVETWRKVKDRCCDELMWGDELEYGLFQLRGDGSEDPDRGVGLSLRGVEVQDELNDREKEMKGRPGGCTWHNEYGSWMIEGTPADPYTGFAEDLLMVEKSMRRRRRRLLAALRPGEVAPTMTCLPTMGAGPCADAHGPVADSDYLPDAVINPHPRFAALTQNIRSRRGSHVDIRVPLYEDALTAEFQNGTARAEAPLDEEGRPAVHMDAMAFGMGCSCLQVTFQAVNLEESRFLHDQLLVLAPVMLALTAATPAFRGRLVDRDTRWKVISDAVDDRTPLERGVPNATAPSGAESMAGRGSSALGKSRYSSSSLYLFACNGPQALNDVDVQVPAEEVQQLLRNGVDEPLARHVAQLFCRDPLVVFEGAVEEVDDRESTEHFDSLQSTNWNSVRWKPPPADGDTGWRVELRTMEVQLTDFENAAFAAFVVLLTRAILAFDLNFYLPMQRVDDNFRRAERRDAVLSEKFYFRKHLAPPEETRAAEAEGPPTTGPFWWRSLLCEDELRRKSGIDDFEEMSLKEIMGGKEDYFPGLVPLCHAYLDAIQVDAETRVQLTRYLELVQSRAEGSTPTAAKWARDLITGHGDYRQDSVVSDAIAHDWVSAAAKVGSGSREGGHLEALLGPLAPMVRPLQTENAYAVRLTGSENRLQAERRNALLRAYAARPKFQGTPASTPDEAPLPEDAVYEAPR